MKRYLKWIICGISLIIFIILSILVLTKKDIYLDSFMYGIVSKYITNNLTLIVKNLTHLGSAIVVIGITVFTLLYFKNKKYALYMTINLVCITILQILLKNIFVRERPIDINLIEETGYSFPSGHSLTAFAFYGFIIYLIYKSNLTKRRKNIFITMFSLFIFIVGLSRVYLGVHFFTDVVGAFSFSLAYLIIYVHIIDKRLKD
ncbi:MAG: phosphatase PAP2 family protein [Bacilli bacterium]|nr:phosphatase PAP2 family protein [Bacilli bacterium]